MKKHEFWMPRTILELFGCHGNIFCWKALGLLVCRRELVVRRYP